MKYPAKYFIENDQKILKALIEAFPLATLICTHQNEMFTSYLPFFWDDSACLMGHLDANNPQVFYLKEGKKVSLIFNGPEAYLSPSHFATNELPTYNYCKVEVEGTVKPILNEELKQGIIQLTTHLEGRKAAYQLTENESRLHSLVNYIYGFKIEIKNIQGRFKMSQDKNKFHQQKALQIMQESLKNRHQLFLETYGKHDE